MPFAPAPLGRAASMAAFVLLGAALPVACNAHGFAGQRFFPATLATDDPFVADELSLPTYSTSRFNAGEGPAGRQQAWSIDIAKRITPNFGLEIGRARERFTYGGAQASAAGFDNLEAGAKWQLYKDEAGESLVSAGVAWEVGGTGSQSIGADSFSTYTPTLYFGKGLGNLKADFLRPLAVTGTVGVAIPGRSSTTSVGTDPGTGLPVTSVERHPHVLQVGLAFEYSLPYLQSAVKDIGLGAPWNRMIPVVEVAAEKPLDRVDERRWTGTVNPGLLWAGRFVQLGIEAVIPMNRASGHGVGVQAQLHFFLDDLFPKTFGQPLVGSR